MRGRIWWKVAGFMGVAAVGALPILGIWVWVWPRSKLPVYKGVERFQCNETIEFPIRFSNPRGHGTVVYESAPGRTPSYISSSPIDVSDVEVYEFYMEFAQLVVLKDNSAWSWVRAGMGPRRTDFGVAFQPTLTRVTGGVYRTRVWHKWEYPACDNVVRYILLLRCDLEKAAEKSIPCENSWHIMDFSQKDLDRIREQGLVVPDPADLPRLADVPNGELYRNALRRALREDGAKYGEGVEIADDPAPK